MKKFFSILIAVVLLCTCFATVACNANRKVFVFLHHYDELDTTRQLIYNKNANLPIPTRDDGYVFDGWYYDEDGARPFANGTEMKDNFHLYGKWIFSGEGIKHTVTLVFNDGTTQNRELKVDDGSIAALPNPPSRADYRFDGWWTQNTGGQQWTNQPVTGSITLYARWTYVGGGEITPHTQHDYGDSYFAYVQCSYEGCTVIGRNAGKRNYENMFDYNESEQAKIDAHYNDATRALNGDVDPFVSALLEFEKDLEYLDGQYSWATLYADLSVNFDYKDIDLYYDTAFVNWCQLILDAANKYGDAFWDLYPDDKQETLDTASLYVNTPGASDADQVLDDYDKLSEDASISEINSLYKRLVDAYNKEAKNYGYTNYMEYAYAEIYNREYGEEDIVTMRNYIKTYIVPAYQQVDEKLAAYCAANSWMPSKFSNTANKNFYNGLMSDSVVKSSTSTTIRDTVNYISKYFAWLDNSNVCDKPVGFTDAVNDMFATGKYFQGVGDGAYTMWVPHDEIAVCYFQPKDRYGAYDTAFTFVHEFGHYYENCHNGGVALSYDHDETQSQGDEMLFLAWLRQNKADGITDGMTVVELQQLSDMLSNIIMSAAVDELEWAAYKGEVTRNFNTKFEQILNGYLGNDHGWDTDYWTYVVFYDAAYYVSYAISALPSVEIYAIAQQNGLDAARTAYLKLFGYCENNNRMKNYSYTGSNGVLDYCGLQNPFESELYTYISAAVSQVIG